VNWTIGAVLELLIFEANFCGLKLESVKAVYGFFSSPRLDSVVLPSTLLLDSGMIFRFSAC